jgi:DNA (cytosine-5)-methyltransferase 1
VWRKSVTPRFTSLFSGCGGLDIGFIRAGYSCVAAFDFDKDAVSSYKKNVGDHITQLDLSVTQPEVLKAVETSDVLVAGPPCQGFSTAGKQDPDDARSSLLLKVAEIAGISRPPAVIIENVRGLLSPRSKSYWDRLDKSLRESGYSVSSRIVEATQFGVAQCRRRVIVLAVLDKHPLEMTFSSMPRITLKEALNGVEKETHHDCQHLAENSHSFKIAKRIQQGQKLSNVRGGNASVHTWDIPEVFGLTTELDKTVLEVMLSARRKHRRRSFGDADPVSESVLLSEVGQPIAATLRSLIDKGFVRKVGRFYDLTNAFNGKFRRLQWDQPAPTVDTRFGQPRYFLHPDEERGFSVREAARIQGFPDTYKFPSSDAIAFKLIGNAVPPPMANAIASFAMNNLPRRT